MYFIPNDVQHTARFSSQELTLLYTVLLCSLSQFSLTKYENVPLLGVEQQLCFFFNKCRCVTKFPHITRDAGISVPIFLYSEAQGGWY